METLLKMLAGLRYVMGRVNCSQAQDFTLSGRPGIGTVLSGGSIVYTTIVAGTNGFSGTTHLSLSGLPAGAGASFAPSSTNFILQGMRLVIFCLLASAVFPSVSQAQAAPVFEITPIESSVKFDVEASVAIKGTFDKWDATLTFASPDVETGVLDIKIQAASVDTGSGMKNGKLKGKDFFDVEHSPLITFKSTKIVQTGTNSFEVDGSFTIRGVTKPEKLTLTLSGKGSGSGQIQGTMAFDRKDYGMNSGIPFVKIANRVEVNVALKGKRVSGPPLVFKQ